MHELFVISLRKLVQRNQGFYFIFLLRCFEKKEVAAFFVTLIPERC